MNKKFSGGGPPLHKVLAGYVDDGKRTDPAKGLFLCFKSRSLSGPEFQINIRKLGKFMLIAAGFGLLHVPFNWVSDPLLRNKLLWCVLAIYSLYCLFVLIRGLVLITWKPFLTRRVRCLLGFLWLIFYPALCLAWLGLCVLLCYYTNPWHH